MRHQSDCSQIHFWKWRSGLNLRLQIPIFCVCLNLRLHIMIFCFCLTFCSQSVFGIYWYINNIHNQASPSLKLKKLWKKTKLIYFDSIVIMCSSTFHFFVNWFTKSYLRGGGINPPRKISHIFGIFYKRSVNSLNFSDLVLVIFYGCLKCWCPDFSDFFANWCMYKTSGKTTQADRVLLSFDNVPLCSY